MLNCVAIRSSLGAVIPGLKVACATAPIPPVLPQAPQVSHVGEFCTLSITVALGAGGVGVGEGEGAGEGEVTGAGVGVGDDPLGVPAAALPPQPVSRHEAAARARMNVEMRRSRIVTLLVRPVVEALYRRERDGGLRFTPETRVTEVGCTFVASNKGALYFCKDCIVLLVAMFAAQACRRFT